jgi:hypothetical protein
MTHIRFVRFPDDFEFMPGAFTEDCPRLIASPCYRYAKLLAQTWPDKWQYLEIKLGKKILYLALSGWEVYEDPIHSPSTKSNAIYYAKVETGGFGFLLGFLAPYSHTSSHWHEERREFYYLIAGQAKIGLNPEWAQLTIPGKSQAMVGTAKGPEGFHPVITQEQPSLVIVQMEKGLDRSDHHYF